MSTEIQRKVKERIAELIKNFNDNPEMFLTEIDIVSNLYNLLLNDFGTLEDTADNPPKKSIPLHCEVRWYGGDANLKIRSDLVILDVSTLITKRKLASLNIPLQQMPSKGFGFNRFHAVIEIKLRRKVGASNNQFKILVDKDRKKIVDLRNATRNANLNFESHIIVFDKKSDMEEVLRINSQCENYEYYTYPYTDE